MTFALKQLADGDIPRFDIGLADGDLETDNGLETAVLLSLFLNRRAEQDDTTDSDDKQGWWADVLDDDLIGSRLWLLNRSKTVNDVLRAAEDYAQEALQWLIDDGLAKKIVASAERTGTYILSLKVDIHRQAGGRWAKTWEMQLNAI